VSENPSRPSGLSRRDLLGAAVTLPLWRAFSHVALAQGRGLETIRKSRGLVVGAGDADVSKVELSRDWAGAICRSRVTNRGTSAVAIKEIVLFDLALDLPPSTSLYAESFQMRLFNWTDAPMTLSARLTRASTVTDFWSGASLGRKDVVTIADMLAHSARLLECRDV
jgi:hypothetical protein